jgi:hypothetical protein
LNQPLIDLEALFTGNVSENGIIELPDCVLDTGTIIVFETYRASSNGQDLQRVEALEKLAPDR